MSVSLNSNGTDNNFGIPSSPKASAHFYLARRGWYSTPNPFGGKRPKLEGWQHKLLDDFGIEKEFESPDPARNIPGDQVGILLGQPSGGLIVKDNDNLDPAFRERYYIPTDLVDGRPGKPSSHEFYRVEDKFKKLEWSSPKTGERILEILGDGQQVIVPPSINSVSGLPRVWERFGEPPLVIPAQIETVGNQSAVAQELRNIWPGGGRHDLCLPVAGGLLRAGWEESEVIWLLEYLCRDTQESRNEIRVIVERTAERLAGDELVSGWPRVVGLTGEKASITAITKWLGLHTEDLDDPRPAINVNDSELARQTRKAWVALGEYNDPPKLFRRATVPVRIELNDKKEQLVLKEVTADRLRHTIADCIRWYRPVKNDRSQPVHPPLTVVRNMLATPDLPLPILERIVGAPVFAADGTLSLEPGYFEAAKTYYQPMPGTAIPEVPERPTKKDINRAKALFFDNLLRDFPFVGDAERAHAVALTLLPFGREFIDGKTPLHLIEAPTAGTGKGLLAEVLTLIALGKSAAATTAPKDEDEWRKRITTELLEGAQHIWIDNINHPLTSDALCAALTAPEWKDRRLGTNETIRVEPRCVWLATANNITVSTEIARRIVRIRMNAKVDMPQNRTGFKYELPAWAIEHRGELIWAALTFWRAWLAQGRPDGKKTLGSFESWAKVMGGVLDAAGIPGFLGNSDELFKTADREGEAWRTLIDVWWDIHGSQVLRSNDVLMMAQSLELFDIKSRSDLEQRKELGEMLTKQVDKVYGDLQIVRDEDRKKKVATWQLAHRTGNVRRVPEEETKRRIQELTGIDPNPLNLEDD